MENTVTFGQFLRTSILVILILMNSVAGIIIAIKMYDRCEADLPLYDAEKDVLLKKHSDSVFHKDIYIPFCIKFKIYKNHFRFPQLIAYILFPFSLWFPFVWMMYYGIILFIYSPYLIAELCIKISSK